MRYRFNDVAVRPVASVTPVCEVQQALPHGCERFGLSTQFLGSRQCQRLDIGTGASLIAPKPQKVANFLNREAKVPGIGRKA